MKHIITYTDNIEALRLKASEVVADHAELSLDEDEAVRLVMPTIGAFYNTVNGVTHSIALIVLPNPYDEDGNLIDLLKDFEGILEILAVGRTDNVNDCPFAKVFADPEKCVKYDLANPLSKEIDEEGNETDKLMPRTKFGVHDLTSTV